jgi:hypothetical protein
MNKRLITFTFLARAGEKLEERNPGQGAMAKDN